MLRVGSNTLQNLEIQQHQVDLHAGSPIPRQDRQEEAMNIWEFQKLHLVLCFFSVQVYGGFFWVQLVSLALFFLVTGPVVLAEIENDNRSRENIENNFYIEDSTIIDNVSIIITSGSVRAANT
ncbi:hypothetical protein ACJX0J_015095, partial [Zea mays]